MIGLDNFIDTKIPQDEGPNDTVMAISLSAVTGGVSAKAFQLRAWIQGREVLLLIDSGSSNSFIDEQLATTLVGVQAMAKPGRVRVADGGEMVCSTYIPHCA
uniref:Uncharacterized protein n=1 Tax=Triticum urartu TaxID=4572 RepID=A0A8R7VJF2_TRIUA